MKVRAASAVLALVLGMAAARAESLPSVRFDPRLVFGGGADARELSQYDHGNPVASGRYRSRIYVNGAWLDTRKVLVRARPGGRAARVCLDRALARRLDLDPRRLRPRARQWLHGTGAPDCLRAGELAAGLHAAFELARLRVDIAAPAIDLLHRPRGWVSPSRWSNGITAARLNYQLSAVRSRADTVAANPGQLFLGLQGGLNAGAWQFRHSGTLEGTSGQGLHYASIRTDLRHDIAGLGGYLLLGQGQTDGQWLDSVAFRGVMLASDPRMQPASEQGFAPVIRGVAASAATVRVSQNGVLLYQTTVPAGSFEINDLYPPAAGTALRVTVSPFNARASSFEVPVSLVPQLQRPGHIAYQILAGRLGSAGSAADRPLALGSLLLGLNDSLTGELGMIAARGYGTQALGAAFNTTLGALQLDVTRARFEHPLLGRQQGQRLRATWNLAAGDTGLSLSATRQSRGFYGPQDVMNAYGALADALAYARARQILQLQCTQALAGAGSAYLSASRTLYWDMAKPQTTVQFGLARSLGRVQLSLSFSRQIGAYGALPGSAVALNLSLPLGSGAAAPSASFGVQRDGQGASSGQWALSGTAGSQGAVDYAVQAGAGPGSRSAGANATWHGPSGSFGAAATVGSNAGATAGALSLYASGGLVAFEGGLSFAPYLGDTIALIRARGATGARVLGGSGSRIDSRGYGVATYLTPYATDRVGIDPLRAGLLRRTSARVVPRAGAIVAVRLPARRGRWVLVTARRPSGAPLPFAARVFDAGRRLVGYVGEGSRIDAHLRRETGQLVVRWGPGEAQACRIELRMPARPGQAGPLSLAGGVCLPMPMPGRATASRPGPRARLSP